MNKKIVLFSAILGLTILAGGLSVKASQEEKKETDITHLSKQEVASDKDINLNDDEFKSVNVIANSAGTATIEQNNENWKEVDEQQPLSGNGTKDDPYLYDEEVTQEESDEAQTEIEALGKPDKEVKLGKDENYIPDENKEVLSTYVIVNEDGTSTVQEWYVK